MNKKKKNLFSPTPSVVKRGTVATLCWMLTKSLLLVFTLLGSATLSLAQNTIVNDNNSWATLRYGWEDNMPICCVVTQYVYFDGDSIVGDHLYKKVFGCNDQLHENIEYAGLMREENQKTYRKWNDSPEYLIYDFSLEEGMSFEYDYPRPVTLYVKTVDFIEINGSMKKRMQITDNPDTEWILDTWIEDVGSLLGILWPCLHVNGGRSELLCYFQNNELIYKNPIYSECYYDKVEDITSVQTIEDNDCYVFPNPVDDVLTISSPNNTLLKIEIFNMFGQQVYSQAYKNTIDISSLPTGLYFLKVYDTNEQVTVVKIIKR